MGAIWDHGPVVAAILLLVADFGIVYGLMWAESLGAGSSAPPPWARSLAKGFIWGDTMCLPLFGAIAVYLLQKFSSLEGSWVTAKWWHITVLIAGFAASILMEFGEMKRGTYTINQELSPSKIWHTLIFGAMAYWMVTVGAGALVVIWTDASSMGALATTALLLLPIAAYFAAIYVDMASPPWWGTHMEGSWIPWSWHVRTK